MTELEHQAGRELVEWYIKYHGQGLSNNQLVGLLEAVKHFTLNYFTDLQTQKDVFREWRESNK